MKFMKSRILGKIARRLLVKKCIAEEVVDSVVKHLAALPYHLGGGGSLDCITGSYPGVMSEKKERLEVEEVVYRLQRR